MIPALKRGLELLKLILMSDRPLGYNEILSQTRLPASSVTRLLKSLEEGRYVVKDASGKYLAGNELLVLGHSTPVFSRLLSRSREILETLSRETGNTAQLLFWNGREIQCLDKIVESFSISMQEIGTITRDCSQMPWGWIFYESLPPARRRLAEREMKDRKGFLERFPGWIASYKKQGAAYDDQEFYPHVRRIAVPIFEGDHIIGAVALGGTILTLPDEKVAFGMARVSEAAAAFSVQSLAPQSSKRFSPKATR